MRGHAYWVPDRILPSGALLIRGERRIDPEARHEQLVAWIQERPEVDAYTLGRENRRRWHAYLVRNGADDLEDPYANRRLSWTRWLALMESQALARKQRGPLPMQRERHELFDEAPLQEPDPDVLRAVRELRLMAREGVWKRVRHSPPRRRKPPWWKNEQGTQGMWR